MNMPQRPSMQDRMMGRMHKVSHVHPPLVYAALGCVTLAFWALGTSVQVLTSEAWMLGRDLSAIDFTAFGQLIQAFTGRLSTGMWIPFIFGWGVQLALIVSSIGVELPRHPRWRFRLAAGACVILIGANSCGDYAASAQYGGWGQLGFTAVIFFLTFVMMLFTVMAFRHAVALAKAKEQE